jgi:hypothetical protein
MHHDSEPSAGKEGPIAWQMHNLGLFDEYKDITIEVEPAKEAEPLNPHCQTVPSDFSTI